MFWSVSLTAVLACATPAFGQRADENAVSAAGDAFGGSVGSEKVTLNDVRPFLLSLAADL